MVSAPESVPAFYEDVYRTEMEVWVDGYVEHERYGPCLVFSETLCHPHGGGQKGDRAVLLLPQEDAAALGQVELDTVGGPLALVDTRREGGRILHILAEPLDEARALDVLVGTRPYTLRLDWDWRFAQMRLHTAAHLLHCFVERVLGTEVGYPETSDLQAEQGLNRYDQKALLDEEQLARLTEELNAFAAAGHAVTTFPDAQRPGFRYWKCEAWVIPCGGTHPANTREVGTVRTALSTRRGHTSITFKVG